MLSTACAAPPSPPLPPGPTHEPDDLAGEPPRTERDAFLDEAETTTREILEGVAAARDLAVTGPVRIELIDRHSVRAFVRDSMYEDHTPEQTRLMGRISAALGVVPLGADMEQVLLDLYQDGVLGIYDPKREVLLIGDFVPRAMLAMVVGHEIVHGLQDMHFDLEALQKPHHGHSERDGALSFLVEGDAQAAYLAWRAGDAGPAGISERVLLAMSDQNLAIGESLIAYPTLARMMQMPYADGTATVLALAKQQGWAAVDALYRDLPTTTEQMLHLDKLVTREPPHDVNVDTKTLTTRLPDYDIVWQDELGEADLLAMLADDAAAAHARKAASGWGGDRFVALDRREHHEVAPLLLGMVAWDSEADAAEFEPAFAGYLAGHDLGDVLVDRRGHEVVYATRFAPHLDRKAARDIAWAVLSSNKPTSAMSPAQEPPTP